MLLLTDLITSFSHLRTSRHPLLVFRKVPPRNELSVCVQQADSLGTAGLYLGLLTGLGGPGSMSFLVVSSSQNCPHCTAEVSGGIKEKGTTEKRCGCHSSASQQKTPLGCIWELLASCEVVHYGRRVNLCDYWLLLCGDSWGVWAFVI